VRELRIQELSLKQKLTVRVTNGEGLDVTSRVAVAGDLDDNSYSVGIPVFGSTATTH